MKAVFSWWDDNVKLWVEQLAEAVNTIVKFD